jgi:uncharacterized zinc-type alcohol dehydrogenase-like protein
MIRAFAASSAGAELEEIQIELGPIGDEQVELDVISCGICHSDLSMLNNDWGNTLFPLVPGHEVVGKVSAIGANVKTLKVGDTVGLGWFSESCQHCAQCLSGNHNLCIEDPKQTIVGRHGGFAEKVRCHWGWAIPLPEGLDAISSGPLFCGGITVFNPIIQNNISPTSKVGVIGIGGLGHLALQFLNKWGCEVVAFSSKESKTEELKRMGAHRVVNSRDRDALETIQGSLDFILSTVNVNLDWESYLSCLAPKGILHLVGVVPEPLPIPAFAMIGGQKSVSGTPLGSPATIHSMLEFCARHSIEAVTEKFPMSKVNEALDHLKRGDARYRIVLENDWE